MRELGISAMPAVSASVLNNTNIFTLTVTSSDPQLAYNVLNAVIEHYPDVAEFVVGPTVMNLLDESGLPSVPYNTRSYRGAVKKAFWSVPRSGCSSASCLRRSAALFTERTSSSRS